MKIDIVVVGELATNCYILANNNHALVIDPGAEYDKIARIVGDKIIDGVIITHYHFDHIGAKDKFAPLLIYDYYNLKEGLNTIGQFTFEVIYTPGHKEDAISIYFSTHKCLFAGDFIFKYSIGRTDLPGGNMADMLKSIQKSKRFDDDVTIYPGHGDSTTFGQERRYNIYFM